MGLLLSAANQLELCLAAAFQNYFVGDPDFVRVLAAGESAPASLFTAAQAVATFKYPIVVFECGDAKETVAQTSIYQAEVFVMVGTHLSERPDDYPSLLKLHQDRCSKVINLLENIAVLKSLLNAPASGPDLRLIRQMNLYGLGTIDQRNKRENNVLMWVASINPAAFQPIG